VPLRDRFFAALRMTFQILVIEAHYQPSVELLMSSSNSSCA
jgi:hypothetical protein